jgi:hypothetical protein
MVAVTERARERLLEMRVSASLTEPQAGFRFKPAAHDRWSLVPDEAAEGDEIVEHDGSTILLVDAELSNILDDMEVDCMEAAPGQFVVVVTRGEKS